MDYRKKIGFKIVNIPVPFAEENRGIDECCFWWPVVASLTSDDSWKNDVKGVWFKKTDASDTATFSITKCGQSGTLPNLGTLATFPNEPLGVGFIYDWKQYLSDHGTGKYIISINYTTSGISGSYEIGHYDLMHYSIERLNGSIRIWSEFRSYNLKHDFDFTGSNFKDSFRVKGYFGFRKWGTVVNNYIDTGRKIGKTTRENVQEYTLRAEPVTDVESKMIMDMHILNEDVCYISDHNALNHRYDYLHFPVSLKEVQEPEYIEHSRLMKIIVTFGDRVLKEKSLYNV